MLLYPGAFYRHVNGHTYVLLHVAVDELGGRHVIHKGAHDGRIWTRTEENFLGLHDTGVPRFSAVTLMSHA